jgi:hypothetical protein
LDAATAAAGKAPAVRGGGRRSRDDDDDGGGRRRKVSKVVNGGGRGGAGGAHPIIIPPEASPRTVRATPGVGTRRRGTVAPRVADEPGGMAGRGTHAGAGVHFEACMLAMPARRAELPFSDDDCIDERATPPEEGAGEALVWRCMLTSLSIKVEALRSRKRNERSVGGGRALAPYVRRLRRGVVHVCARARGVTECVGVGV